MQILVVDDNPDVRTILRVLFSSMKFDVVEAADGQQAIDLLRGEMPPDLVFLDLFMPNVDGYAVLNWALETPAIQHIPIVIMTAFYTPSNIDPIQGAHHVMSKSNLLQEARQLATDVLLSE